MLVVVGWVAFVLSPVQGGRYRIICHSHSEWQFRGIVITMEIDLLALFLSTLTTIASLAVIGWIHNQYHMDVVVEPSGAPPKPQPEVSVIVPARNEADNIRRCVEALLDQTYTSYELIVLDDRSTDETPQILAQIRSSSQAGRLKILEGRDLPPGWAGKPFALAQASRQAQGEWLCFVDADTFARPSLLAATVAKAQDERADMFTILTDQILGSFWEKAILPLVFTALSVGFPARRVNDPEKSDAIANGQFILIRRAVYLAVGGHEAVRDRIAEDRALADLVKRRGYRLIVADGRAVARTRMYTSFPEIWEGWTKNIFLGMQGRLGLLLFGALVALLAALFLPGWLLVGAVWFLSSWKLVAGMVLLEAILVWGTLLWLRVQAARAFHISSLYALTLPLGALIFAALMIASAYKVLSGQGVTWKGRTYRGTPGG
jgi:chlorobactene glucosyltransferase